MGQVISRITTLGRGDRLYVTLYLSREPELRIEFPTSEQAHAYYNTISRTKDGARKSGHFVFSILPSSVRKLEPSQTLGGFVFSFQSARRAADWQDDICRVVRGNHRSVVVKERWLPGELDRALGVFDHARKDHARADHDDESRPPSPAEPSYARSRR